ncbi:sphingomyelin phosphodiesterase 1-like isoform X2 [Euwallacea fornicatus]|uniref:sphingomyelin phosphodiesterase 1-like isoform X2 n=1 Tax=Euwallacea fornicatus TaxID=995702 RepID=UPI00338DDE5B
MKTISYYLVLAVVLVFMRSIQSQDQDDEDDEPSFDDRLKMLQKQFADHLGIRSYRPMDVLKLKTLLSELGIIDELRTQMIQDRIMCGTCQALIRKLQLNDISVQIIGTAICTLYISLTTLTLSDFCKEIIRINRPILEFIVRESHILTPEYACSVLLQNDNCYYSNPALTWRIEIPEGGPGLNSKVHRMRQDEPPLKILHLSDFHVSFDYAVRSVSDCGYPVCCKRGLGNPLRPHNAGSWGDYNCDIPPWLLGNTMTHINNTHKDIDLIYFTGDIIDHTIWKASKDDNSREIASTFRVLAESFPNTPILPAIGNHESVPLNVFAPPSIKEERFSQNWLYELNSKLLTQWIPPESLTTVRSQGYFAILANYKLRVIVLNNNVCYIYNCKVSRWLLYDTRFLREQLEFLKKELLEAESLGQYVHIVSHVFPGTRECIEPWEVNYNSLITRFAHIIKGQFFGHTHTDSLKVFYSKIDGTPNNVGYNGASLTPFVKYNPNYKIVVVDPDTFDVLDVETYYFNLTEANLHPNRFPRWQLLYSMKEAYQFDQLSPENIDMLAQNLFQNRSLFNQYWRYYVRDSDISLQEGCNTECRTNLISDIIRTESMTSV